MTVEKSESPDRGMRPDGTRSERVRMLIGEREIAARVEALAASIAADFADPFLVVVALKGGFVFAADLVRALSRHDREPQVSFVRFSSYAGSTRSSGEVRLVGLAPEDVSGRRVLVVDDILDTGRTMQHAKELLRRAGATEVRFCTLLDKPARREVEIDADYVGFPIEDRFVVGYGLDHAERYRTLPYVGTLDLA